MYSIRVPEYYQGCSNDHLGLTVTFFILRQNMEIYLGYLGEFRRFCLKMVITVVLKSK